MNRLKQTMSDVLQRKRKIVCAFLTLGYPSVSQTEKLIVEFEKIGVDVIELGFPFSDPLADGPTIQRSSEYALKHGVKLQDAFKVVASVRKQGVNTPIVFFSYINPIYALGIEKTAKLLAQSGFDGVVIPDLPPDELGKTEQALKKNNLLQIHLVAPTTEAKRARWIAKKSQGFIYYVSLRGVTGARQKLGNDLAPHVKALKRIAKIPVLVGFGISTREHVKKVSRIADGVIVGSAIVQSLSKKNGGIRKTIRFVKSLVLSANP